MRNFTYDHLNRQTAEKWMSGGTVLETFSYAYNADGQLTSAANPDSAYAYAYDGMGRKTSVDDNGTPSVPRVVLSDQYDPNGNRAQLAATIATAADFQNVYTYDALNRLTQLYQQGQTGGNAVAVKGANLTYNLLGQLVTVARTNYFGTGPAPDIATGTFSYDAANRLTKIAYTHNGGTATDAHSWVYDAADRVTSMTTTTDGTANYSYDNTNQVTGASYTGTGQPANESYSYDANGNRTNAGYSTATNNQVSSDGTFNYAYDAEGNRTSRTRISTAPASDYVTTYTWDYRDRLTDVNFYNNSNALSKHVHYTYDVFDHRISKSLDATGSGSYSRIEDYVYDGDHVVLDFVDPDGAGPQPLALATRYLNGPSNDQGTDQVFAQENASTGAVLWLLSDNLGTTRDIVDNNSTLQAHFVYNSFGRIASGPTNVTRFLYTGQEWDADAGLQYNWHRWYDPAVGRWISADPTGFAAGDSNLSRYVGNNAANGIDPSGLRQWVSEEYQYSADGTWGWLHTTYDDGTSTNSAYTYQSSAKAGTGSWVNSYSAWFNNYVPGGQMLTNAMEPGIQEMLGDRFLASATDAQLFGLTATAVTGSVLAGTGAAALAATLGLSGLSAATLTGATAGAGDYFAWVLAGQAWSGGQSNGPTFAGAMNATLSGAAGGAGGYGIATFAKALVTHLPCGWFGNSLCFVAGTPVVVPGIGDEGAFISESSEIVAAGGGDATENRWLWSLVLVGVGFAGLRAAAAEDAAAKEESRRRKTLESLFGPDFDKLDESDNEDDAMNSDDELDRQRRIDAVCDLLFNGDDQGETLFAATVRVEAATALRPASPVLTCASRRPVVALCELSTLRTSKRPAPISNGERTRRGFGGIWLAACLLLAAWLGFGHRGAPPDAKRPALASASPKHVTRAIERIRVGQRVVANNPDLPANERSNETAVDPADWRLVRLHAEERWEDGTLDTIEVEALQPLAWIAENGLRRGDAAPLPLDLVEMGLSESLQASVVAIEPCPPIERGPGSVVLTTVNHLNRFICELTVEDERGERETIQPTGWHKFYSATRAGWVSASDLRRGERLSGLDVPFTVVDVTRRPGIERVYNMTVEGQHVYHVSASGILVHNTGCGPDTPDVRALRELVKDASLNGNRPLDPSTANTILDWAKELAVATRASP